jgi:hypothetical protein
MSVSVVQYITGTAFSTTGLSVTFPSPTTTGNAIVVFLGAWSSTGTEFFNPYNGSNYGTVTDNINAGSYPLFAEAPTGLATVSGYSITQIYGMVGITGGSTTVSLAYTAPTMGTYATTLIAVELAGVPNAYCVNGYIGAHNNSSSVSSGSFPIYNSQSSLLLGFGFDQSHSGDTFTASAGFSNITTVSNGPGSTTGTLFSNLVSPPGSYSNTLSSSNGSNALHSAVIAITVTATGPLTNVRSTQVVNESVIAGSPNVRSTQLASESVIAGSPHTRSTQSVIEGVIAGYPHTRTTQIVIEGVISNITHAITDQVSQEAILAGNPHAIVDNVGQESALAGSPHTIVDQVGREVAESANPGAHPALIVDQVGIEKIISNVVIPSDAIVDQVAIEQLSVGNPHAIVDQLGLEYLLPNTADLIRRVTQVVLEVITPSVQPPPINLPVIIQPVKLEYSHITQKMLNYFPDTDLRIRENPFTIGAQLLNAIACQVEQQQVKINREVRALNFSSMPMNIDNGGVYYATRVPTSFNLPNASTGGVQPPNSINGYLSNGKQIALIPYDDTLPTPTRISQDPVVQPVALSNPQLINVVGTGIPLTFSPGVLPLPNKLTFQIVGMGAVTSVISISIMGELDPPAVWPQDIKTNNEILNISDDGFYQTNSIWSSVSGIDIHGLPSGCGLICWVLPVNLPAVGDTDRPFTHFAYRGITFPRYWQLNNFLLQEVYQRNRFSGYEIHQTYRLSSLMTDVAVEPNTNGLFLTDGSHLFYMDRRQPLPDNLFETGLTQEPLYGINVWYNSLKPGINRYAHIEPTAMAQASTCNQYRYVVEDPLGNVFVLSPSGILQEYTGATGWQVGYPVPADLPLTTVGTYLITLEMLGTFNAKTTDTFAYGNFNTLVRSTVNLSSLVPQIKGIAFDAYNKLWVWTGSYAVPLKISYDAYVWDADTRTIYCTDQYTQLSIQ